MWPVLEGDREVTPGVDVTPTAGNDMLFNGDHLMHQYGRSRLLVGKTANDRVLARLAQLRAIPYCDGCWMRPHSLFTAE